MDEDLLLLLNELHSHLVHNDLGALLSLINSERLEQIQIRLLYQEDDIEGDVNSQWR